MQLKIGQLMASYDVKNQQYTDLVNTAKIAEEAIKQALEVLSYAVVHLEYTSDQLEADKKVLIDLIGGADGI